MKKVQSKYLIIIIGIMSLSLFLIECEEKKTELQAWADGVTYSNLVDQESQEVLRSALEYVDVPMASIDILLESINKYNNAVGSILPVQSGFDVFPKNFADAYNSDKLKHKWDKAYGTGDGMKNCRLTAFEAMKSLISYNDTAENLSEALYVVEREDTSVFQSKTDMNNFTMLFAGVRSYDEPEEFNTEQTVERIADYWKTAGIQFSDNDKIAMISLVDNVQTMENNDSYSIHCGHCAVMIHTQNDTVLILEKLSFELPYQLIQFPAEEDALQYLVDFNYGGIYDTATILVNDKLRQITVQNPW